MKSLPVKSLLLFSTSLLSANLFAATNSITPDDIMRFESLNKPVISDNGKTLAVEVEPDRGDSHGFVKSLIANKHFNVAGGTKPEISHDGRFVAFIDAVPLLDLEKASKKAKKKLKSGLILLDTNTGLETRYERVKSFEFNETGSHLAIWFEADEKKKDEKSADEAKSSKSAVKVDDFDKGTLVELVDLKSNKSIKFNDVTGFNFDKSGLHLALAINNIEANKHELRLVNLANNTAKIVKSFKQQQLGSLALSHDGKYLGFTSGNANELPYGREYQLSLLNLETNKLIAAPTSQDWTLNRYAELRFSDDSQRLFFGRVPQVSQQIELAKVESESDLFDQGVITAGRELRIWHGDDPRIKPHEVKQYKKEQKRTYLAVLHVNGNNLVQLADLQVPDVEVQQQKRYVLASSDLPYRKMITWAGFYRDYYLVDLNTGRKIPLLTQQSSADDPVLSPAEKYVVYYLQGNVFLYEIGQDRRTNLTKSLAVPFANEDHDYPSNAPGYGFGPWIADDTGLLIYDKFDIWQVDTTSHDAFMLTAGKGREEGIQYRVTGLVEDKDKPSVLSSGQKLLVQGYNDKTKGDGFYQVQLGVAGVSSFMDGDYKLKMLARSKDANTIIYSKERYDQFPDLYSADYASPQDATRQTDLDKQRDSFNWAHSELVHWTNGDGKQLDGVLIKPTNYVEGQRYPVLVYFYRFMSDRLHAFPQMKINHRPNFAWFADNGYAIFLPDIRFEVGYPGDSSVQALTSGVQHLIDIGVADPNAVGIQGHSWGGYQTAFAVTKTNIFKAAVTGAPVSNMTSAYSGIRHGSGLARQFQYETGQSRIGESLFKSPQKYIENSPVFYVERMKTPMMIMFGDKDDAVPWEQGVELYLAMRRAGKDVVFLQYQDEPHHLKKYPNKLDYSIRMMEYFDHYLKGKPAPKWLTQGEAYTEYKKAE
ncbi:S9 family peptidase [Shewanella fidelis]|uniref:Prolyl oligopeptidase family serine peptidase n=1 Tax=Shewanella fidelis TaxID=173509 RepID=A0AAW8NJE1_9GAMM|nr:prolyl oligopeptidase family serine peptidase [Shewanella fidelis]MDR8522982.1 prolyl oligopeptidase family serine peptidase [Shewanella fidelis]MDW4811692.1 prolyl oligopeptidase family serine peptidase [Shewanella fidelis]MDW4815813.1 prolyl oligopeptidase family serine peptidase [Shewanella fidelis]MDW4819903.1 prolyl oligopeptidase family serine peptidase [Shewanella fidelis]MDW4824123.1 prolyl oligopeptidase family serine peptidase [Shewanella fidelis]